MAELSRFWTTNDVGDGPAAGYEQDLFADFMVGVFTDGVLRAVAGELAVTGVVTPIAIATGAAICGGRYYQNTTLLQLGIATPSVGTTAFVVLLEADWTAQEVRAYVNRADDGNEVYPSPDDNWGTTVEVKIAQGLIDVAGNISLTGGQTWAIYSTTLPEGIITTSKLVDEAVTAEKIKDSNVTTSKIKDLAVTTSKIADLNVTNEKIADGAISNSKINELTIDTEDIEDSAIVLNKLGIGTFRFRGRLGDETEPEHWWYSGEAYYDNEVAETQCGSKAFDFAGAATVDIDIYYPRVYSTGAPLGFVTFQTDYVFAYYMSVGIKNFYTDHMTVTITRDTKNTSSIAGRIFWYVMGGPVI